MERWVIIRHTRKQCSTTIQPQPPSGGSSYWISFCFSFLVVMASFLNRFMAPLVSLEKRRKKNTTSKSHVVGCLREGIYSDYEYSVQCMMYLRSWSYCRLDILFYIHLKVFATKHLEGGHLSKKKKNIFVLHCFHSRQFQNQTVNQIIVNCWRRWLIVNSFDTF